MDNQQLCRCCNSVGQPIFNGGLLNNQVDYFDCPTCGYVQTETPHWLEQAYAVAINDSDTGIMVRNQSNARIVLATLMLLGKLDGTVVDCAGGYGILVRLLRDYGINALWSDQYCQNLLARGFEYKNEPAELVTAFEAFEHFVNPAQELDRLLAIAPNVLCSTEIIADPAPKQDDWWYYGKEHGQHIGFFRIRTLEKLAQQSGKYLVSNGTSYHLITSKPVNHTMWKLMIRLNRFIPILLRHKLVTKVWSDHNLMAGVNK
ncbi:class I SAM-dependent methyltransferase [bacterium]|jgi:hypothetical protein|nr:class I SAM-dependent methyltransferase [bacterium]